jgi:GNAT superfamily N-acetyltransferase
MLTVRPAHPEDVPLLRGIAAAAYRRYVSRIGRQPAPMTADYDELVTAGRVWLAVDDDIAVGLMVLLPRPDHLLVDNVAVLPDAQGTGVGTSLLVLAEREAYRQGLGELRLYTNEAMTENLVYYPRRGFVETHRSEQNGFRRVFFRKLLP